MCIRDRNASVNQDLTMTEEEQDSLVAGRLEGGLYCQGCEPVSYTHLRAHETVLDLVCRLLLEKKKNIYT